MTADHPRRTETVDRYLETVYYIEHEGETVRPGRMADWLGVSAPTVSVAVQRLARDGWITVGEDRSLELTARGHATAREIVRRHRILERWLTDVLGLDWATADREAATLAHGVSALVLDRIDALLGTPATCPHGNLIPGRHVTGGGMMGRLADLAAHTRGAVARISEVAEHEAPHLLSFLHREGLVPGAEVTVTSRSGADPMQVRVGDRDVEVRADVARAVWVLEPR